LRVIFMLILIGLINPMLEHVEAESRRISGDKFHIPSNLVVDQWASDGESRSHRDFLVLHDV
jgi:hypothetical protein